MHWLEGSGIRKLPSASEELMPWGLDCHNSLRVLPTMKGAKHKMTTFKTIFKKKKTVATMKPWHEFRWIHSPVGLEGQVRCCTNHPGKSNSDLNYMLAVQMQRKGEAWELFRRRNQQDSMLHWSCRLWEKRSVSDGFQTWDVFPVMI